MFRIALLLSLFAQPAFALSCLQPDPVSDYLKAAESEDVWIVVTGVLRFDAGKLPETDLTGQSDSPAQTDIPARIEGLALGDDGFKTPFSKDITLRAQCFGPWCGGAMPDARYLAFLKRESGSYTAFAGPCGSQLYADPKPHVLRQIETCFAGGPCEPDPKR